MHTASVPDGAEAGLSKAKSVTVAVDKPIVDIAIILKSSTRRLQIPVVKAQTYLCLVTPAKNSSVPFLVLEALSKNSNYENLSTFKHGQLFALQSIKADN